MTLPRKTPFSMLGSWLRNQHPIVSALALCALSMILCQLILLPFEVNWVKDIEFRPTPLEQENHWAVKFLMAVILAPLLETILFQVIPFKCLHHFRFFRRHRWAIVLIGGVLFGSQHCYSVSYIIATTLMGAILMYAYIIKWRKRPYWNVVLFHGLWNIIVLGGEWIWG